MAPAAALRKRLGEIYPGAAVEEIRLLDPDVAGDTEGAVKDIGYGSPLRVTIREANGTRRSLVFHTANSNDFDHDRRSDRAKNMLLAYDTFGLVPNHVSAVDVGAISDDGELMSLAKAREFYLLTDFANGDIYATDLRRIATKHTLTKRDEARCDRLTAALVSLHGNKEGRPAVYRRAIRNLVGDGEGIFGMIDGYPPGTPAAPPARLKRIEGLCSEWRWKLRPQEGRCSRIHGDFHPFNILFEEHDTLHLLDASRGCHGDPADDVTCLVINYLFFALDHPGAWTAGLQTLWKRFWRTYLNETRDEEVLLVAPPYFTWRALVLANPVWYPALKPAARDALLGFAQQTLEAGALDPDRAEALFA